MPFIVPQNHQKNDLPPEIDSNLKNIQLSIDSLNKRLDKLEHYQRDSYQAISRLEQHANNDSKPDSSFGGLILLVIVIAVIVFGFHFWDVPAQTNAINQYIYEKIIREQTTYPQP